MERRTAQRRSSFNQSYDVSLIFDLADLEGASVPACDAVTLSVPARVLSRLLSTCPNIAANKYILSLCWSGLEIVI